MNFFLYVQKFNFNNLEFNVYVQMNSNAAQ